MLGDGCQASRVSRVGVEVVVSVALQNTGTYNFPAEGVPEHRRLADCKYCASCLDAGVVAGGNGTDHQEDSSSARSAGQKASFVITGGHAVGSGGSDNARAFPIHKDADIITDHLDPIEHGNNIARALRSDKNPIGAIIGNKRVRYIEVGRIASMFVFREWVEAGGLLSYGPSLIAQFVRVAEFVDRITRGAKPADLPIEQPTKFELVVNLKTARAIGIGLSTAILLRADEVIE